MANTKKLPDDATLADHLDSGMTFAQIAESYDVKVDAVRRRLHAIGLRQVNSRQIPVDMAGLVRSPVLRGKRGIFLRPDRITFMRDTAGPNGGLEIRPLSLPRVGMYVAALADRKIQFSGGERAILR